MTIVFRNGRRQQRTTCVALGALHRDDTAPGVSVVAQLCVRRSPVRDWPVRGVWPEAAGEAAWVSGSSSEGRGTESS
jgi:hypothetical protein